mmetsp:Transcript_26156/g.41958  ORF Transcript_26156/g.41958 Transcript_26156/m.41958 type:complete len:176 (-) Transcript_26156:1039-1566(-)
MSHRNDPYAADTAADPNMIEKMWSDPRLHGNKRKVGTDEKGHPVYDATNGAEKRAKRSSEALNSREREYDLMQEKKRRMEEFMAAEAELLEANKPKPAAAKKSKKEKKREKKDAKEAKKSKKKEAKESKKKDKKKEKKSKKSRKSSGSSSSGSSSESEEEDPTEKFRLSGFFSKH